MITDFTLFHVTYVHPQTCDLVYKGLMRRRDAEKFIMDAELQGVATCVELAKEYGNTNHSGREPRQHDSREISNQEPSY